MHAHKSTRPLCFDQVTAVTPGGMQEQSQVLVQDGRVAAIDTNLELPDGTQRIPAQGLLLCPGFIDLHSDAIEKEIRPRPGGSFPLDIALTELDKRLAACGVTTMYHCLCFGESETNDLRTAARAEEIALTMRAR